MPRFHTHIGIDYSGAATPETRLPGIRISTARGGAVSPRNGAANWSRRAAAEWLLEALQKTEPAIVGIDHGFSFPLAWFDAHGVEKNWGAFLAAFCSACPANRPGSRVDGFLGQEQILRGNARWRRRTEIRCGAKSVFHFGVPGSVAKSTHAGIPWLDFLRRELGAKIHFWPFDGFGVPPGKHVAAEVYPSLWRRGTAPQGISPDAYDAWTAARALFEADATGTIGSMLQPELPEADMLAAQAEGWILGVR
jgi:hypothetical protein